MFRGIRNSWALIVDSAAVLRADKELIVFPAISTVLEIVVLLCFLLPALVGGLFDSLIGGQFGGVGFLVGAAFITVQYYVTIFAKSALVGAAMIRLRGGDPTVSDGFHIVTEHAGPIFGYSLFRGLAGTILRWLAKRGKLLGRMGAAIGGLAWEMATYLVLPVLIEEDVGPIEAITRSASLLKETWGEQIAGKVGADTFFGLIKLVIIGLVVLAFWLGAPLTSTSALALTVVAALLAWTLASLLESTFDGIYVAAVYRYAAEGEASAFFGKATLEAAFQTK
jgi:hypothetical protein